ncbi:MAG: adenylate/guanylate cyclase domain-containing protein [Bacteroidota bacterium]
MPERKVSHLIQRSVLGLVLGLLYAAAAYDGHYLLPLGAFTGFLIGLITAWLDHYVFTGKIRRLRFSYVLLIRSLSYLASIFLCLILMGTLYFYSTGARGGEILHNLFHNSWVQEGNIFWSVAFSFALILAFQYINLTVRLLGPNTLRNYILGKYHKPVEEERIFMFLDIKGSTTIAERLGHYRWHNMLNDFFFDLAEPVNVSLGAIYQYVGDEVVISWPKKRGVKNLNVIRCFYRIKKKLTQRQSRYEKRYGVKISFKAGCHIGKVISGEIGDLKREIVFHGDTVNTASRIQEECNRLGREFLISELLLKELDLGSDFISEFMGSIHLRGKEVNINLFSILPAPSASSDAP